MTIKGYKPISYDKLQKDLNEQLKQSGKSLIELATAAKVSTTTSIYSIFNQDKQVVSDKVLSSVFTQLEFCGLIIWINGERYYYIKTKQAS